MNSSVAKLLGMMHPFVHTTPSALYGFIKLMSARILALGNVRVGKMKTKSNYLMTLLIIMCGLDLLDWNINIPEYVTVPTVLIIFILVFAKILYDFRVTKKNSS